MKDDILRTVYVATTLDAYRNFFNDDWGERVGCLTASQVGPALPDAGEG